MMLKSKSVLVPTVNLAMLLYRSVKAGRTGWNYLAAARDASGGIYVQLAVVDWLPPGQVYFNPHTRT